MDKAKTSRGYALDDKFNEMAADQTCRDRTQGIAVGIKDRMYMACSPDCYDQNVAYEAEKAIDDMKRWNPNSPWIGWAEDVLAFANDSAATMTDMRGMKKNIHHTTE